MNWSERAREWIGKVHATLPPDLAFKERKRAIRDAYPFGEREYWPYKAWCKAQRTYLNRYDPKVPQPPLFDQRAAILDGRDDIIFPFAVDATTAKAIEARQGGDPLDAIHESAGRQALPETAPIPTTEGA